MTVHPAEDQRWACRHDQAGGMMPMMMAMMIRSKSVFGLLLMIGMMPSEVTASRPENSHYMSHFFRNGDKQLICEAK